MNTGLKQSLRALLALKPKQKLTAQYLLSLAIAVLLAFLVGAGIMLLCGYDPVACYTAMFTGALGNAEWTFTFQGLEVEGAFAGDDKISMFHFFIELGGIQEILDAIS